MSATDERTQRRHEVRRGSILDAAAEEFAASGYSAATLERIGERVGLSKASLYHYVTGKEQLLAALLARVTERIVEEAEADEGATSEERLRAFVRAHVRNAATSSDGRVLAENLDALTARTTSGALAEVRRAHEERLAAILRDGIAEGIFRPLELRPTVKLIFGAVNGVPRWFDPAGTLSIDELADEVVDLLTLGLKER